MTRERWKRTKREYQRYYISGTIDGRLIDWTEVESVSQIFINDVVSKPFAKFTVYFRSGNKVDAKYDIDKKEKVVAGWFGTTRKVAYKAQDYFDDKSEGNPLQEVRELRELIDKILVDNIQARVRKGSQ